MLTQIQITNLFTIQELTLDIPSGTSVITGETGAGKSIIIDAVELVLGNRATADMVRLGQDKADISLCFDIHKLSDARAWLKSYDLDNEHECIIRRVIHKDGRSRSYINGMPTTLQPLRELSDLLINIHGQHENQTLLKSDKQREMLDRFAGHQILVDQVQHLAQDWQALATELQQLRTLSTERNAHSEFLRFQLSELDTLQLHQDEFQALDLEHKQLAHGGELLENINLTLHCLEENENYNTLSLLNQSIHALESIQQVNPKIKTWVENLKSAMIQISDTEGELRHYLETIEIDPGRLQWLETRIGALFDTARKHKVAPHELYDLQQKITQELTELDTSDARIVDLEKNMLTIKQNYFSVANKLSLSREKIAKKLEREITQTIQTLSLPHGQFQVQLVKEEAAMLSPYGLEKIGFQIKTNAGQPLQSLAKVVSGGELSRISLAIHMATAEQHTIPTLIFDEVDVGIGGGVAELVGKLLRRLGSSHQILCITHLPQVAAQGHQHFLVEKSHAKNSTLTRIRPLSIVEKTQEIARMLGGVEITQKTLAHAQEMLDSVECI